MTTSDTSPDAESALLAERWFAERPRLLGLAYTVLGSWADAEDVLSEAWLRFDRAAAAPDTAPRDLPAWLTTVVSRLALDAAATAAKRREEYIGQWLPEVSFPETTSAAADPEGRFVLGEQVNLAFVRMLQTLTPVDRVIVVLADVVELSHKEIAQITGTTAAATRQRLRRARASLKVDSTGTVDADHSVTTADRATLDALADALNAGDLRALVDRLSEGCVLWTDSGGLSRAARNPVFGPDKVTRFLAGLIEKYGMPRISVADAVGGPVLRAVSADMTRIATVEMDDGGTGRITGLQIQQNPHKILGGTPNR